jgi:hypothetical protein
MTRRSERRLFHGGHKGAEAEFGRAAEEFGLNETTLSFEGHRMERAQNVELLDDARLDEGRVSMEFVFQAMGRRFVEGKGLRRVIHSMFHLVVRTDELFAIGWIQDDDTVKGGTGWGVELAKLFNRRVHVFDQDQERWFTWRSHRWEPSEPELPEGPFSATGTRDLSAAGRQAIRDLFERSVGTAVAGSAAVGRARRG